MGNPNSSGALSSLYQLLLFKRIESSLYAFYMSLQNIKLREAELKSEIGTENWDKILEKYNQALLEKEEDIGSFSEAAERAASEEKSVRLSKEDVLRWIEEDTKAIDEFISLYFHPLMKDKANPLSLEDPKIEAFIDTLRNERFRKALVFTEYIATSEYLAHRLALQAEGGIRIKFAAVSALTKEDTVASVLDRFAPVGRKAQNLDPAQEIDLLISTDMLSEGVNLQDADLLINFDLPWNPMRIVQRVGRVNRIGSEKAVTVLNFVPDAVLEDFLNLLKILSSKTTQVTALLGKERAILSSEDEQIDARDIGEAIRKLQSSTSVADIELLSKKSALFTALQGETDEDFFRMELFVASRKLRVRPSDFSGAPLDNGSAHYYCALSATPVAAYRLFEIYGQRDGRRDLLLRLWLRAFKDGHDLRHPSEFLHHDLTEVPGYSMADFANREDVEALEESLSLSFERILEERREQNSPRNLDKRAQKITGRQRDLATLLNTLGRQLNLGESFIDTAVKMRPDAKQVLDEVTTVLRFQQLSADQLRTLSRSMDAHSIDPARTAATPAQHKDIAQVVFDFYDTVVLKDAALRVHLYTRAEIHGRALATIYI